jgi:hypothetical protein
MIFLNTIAFLVIPRPPERYFISLFETLSHTWPTANFPQTCRSTSCGKYHNAKLPCFVSHLRNVIGASSESGAWNSVLSIALLLLLQSSLKSLWRSLWYLPEPLEDRHISRSDYEIAGLNNNFVHGLAMNTKSYMDSTIHSASY